MSAWPFDDWLRLGVKVLKLSPEQIWKTSLHDWTRLTAGKRACLSPKDLSGLMHEFPDTPKRPE